MSSATLNRVDAMTLDFDENGRYLEEGKPFTGLLYLESESGALEAEQEVRDGYKWGAQREWHVPGVLTLEWHAVKGEPHGGYRSFHANGNLASDKKYEFGVCVSERSFEETGVAKESWQIGPSDADYRTWEARKQRDAGSPDYR